MDQTFDTTGSPDSPALVLVHGSVVTRKMWLPQLRGLSSTFHVLAPDLPGHGSLAHIPFSFAASVQVLGDLIRTQAQSRALVAGLSLGGYVAIQLAHQHPQLVAGLVLSGCTLNFTGGMGLYLKLVSGMMKRGWIKQSRAQAEAKTRRLFPPALADVCAAQMQAGVYPEVLGPSFAEMAGVDYTLPLAAYPGPVLILNGENDTASHRGESKFMAALRQGRLQRLTDAGHACSLDQPEAFNQVLIAFGREINWVLSGNV